MASKFARDRGFEEERFQSAVSDNFKCSICLNVLNNPQSCRNNQHYFCSGCIGEHLKNSHTCPECMEELTPETLVQPPRVLLNCILELRIKCHHSERGCPQYVQLGRLQNHADECGFAPAQCGNEGCEADVNRCEKVRHETELCKFRKVECYGCGELKKEIQELRKSQEKANENIMEKTRKEMNEMQIEIERKLAEVLENQLRMKVSVKEAAKESLEKIESIFNDDQIQNSQASKPDVAQSSRQINHDIFVIGGRAKDGCPTNSTEKFCSKEGIWLEEAPMITPRESASSVVFNNHVIVSGGIVYNPLIKKNEPTDSIEVLNLAELPLKWAMFAAKLPFPMNGHRTFVYKGKLIVVCTYYKTEKDYLGRDVSKPYHTIHQVPLSPPYSASQLYTLSSPDSKFIAELVNDKLFIFGNKSVKIYDLEKKDCREMPKLPLPYPLEGMTNVPWKNHIILFGGNRNDWNISRGGTKSNTVIQYSTITGESKILAPMNHKRYGCAAVVIDDLIIAMGGQGNFNSAECYNLRTGSSQALPVMRERRCFATAVVSPI